MQVMAYLSLGTLAPPEHRHAQRAQAHPVGILQQLGLATFARAAIPVTDPYLIDRIAAIAALKGCGVLVCLNKTDLDPAEELFDIYSRSAIPVLRVSAETGEGMEALRERIRGKLSVFTGNSGVGKSSILNRLCPNLSLRVGEVSQALGRGRHTTRHVEMFPDQGSPDCQG